ncbi:hypothetical protein PUNSTDRAFT_144100 [Punctularia strigosozonata HHB-11173 SS5]|uniref:uncharacterized protein n=1 Tax=Punctularia strigosozonata (strain HHB-11173) TaxID=741275 RepID=UPI0004417178|nr:uncharacterized protein PUNSTDRAFT_144100 [Punctularia strigosozonata HHB-11173 SS5]EIN08561.1 hypothetical protein PUNSTDRAFT_144100 [Punctularia strigosozonata HHB-11173 SS5]
MNEDMDTNVVDAIPAASLPIVCGSAANNESRSSGTAPSTSIRANWGMTKEIRPTVMFPNLNSGTPWSSQHDTNVDVDTQDTPSMHISDAHASATRQAHNASLPIARLPADLVSEIFTYLVHSYTPSASSSTLTQPTCSTLHLAVAQVCAFWRAVALRTTRLWSALDLRRPALALTLLERFPHLRPSLVWAYDRPLLSKPKDFADVALWSWIFANAPSRVVELHLSAYASVMRRVLGAFKGQAPTLRHLSLRRPWNSSIAEIEDTEEYLHDLYAPALEHLELVKMPFVPWGCALFRSASRCLRRLVIKGEYRPKATTLTAVLDALEGMPALRELVWVGRLPEAPLLAAGGRRRKMARRVVQMPRLRRLEFGGTSAGCLTLLRHLALVKPLRAKIRCDGDESFVQIWEIMRTVCLPSSVPESFSSGESAVAEGRSLRIAYLGNEVEVVVSAWRTEPLTLAFRTGGVRCRLHIVRTLAPWLALVRPTRLELEMGFGEHYADPLGEWREMLAGFGSVRELHLKRTSGATFILRAMRYGRPGVVGREREGHRGEDEELLPKLERMIIEGVPNTVDGPWLGACCKELERRKKDGRSKLREVKLVRCDGITAEELKALRGVNDGVGVSELGCFDAQVGQQTPRADALRS